MHYNMSLAIRAIMKKIAALEEAVFGLDDNELCEVVEDPEELGYYLREIIGDEPK